MKILFFGDIIGKLGRKAFVKILPELKQEYQPDLVIANVENLAHGAGVTAKTLSEIVEAGADFYTSGNHIFSKPEAESLLNDPASNLIRPANYFADKPGKGFKVIEVGSRSLLVINLIGQVFMKDEVDSPFEKIDEILSEVDHKNLAGIIVDFHAEATSEKNAFGHYVDGRVSAVLGTHTHIPTADQKILSKGTAYVTDIGMVGEYDSVIGDKKEPIIASFLAGEKPKIEVAESGEAIVSAILLEIDPDTKKATGISRVDRKIKV
ncbi:MAG: TIGR00282 family metallophosphoesterase [Parcubacteria group bacterium]|nr:TIGR00282 family metallophosphoesterase [Parcubacteria group bacterium]|tara:strand:+ start:373 stop:1167 length:795 start_codon:yes stop_codon:yes gene_type:complete